MKHALRETAETCRSLARQWADRMTESDQQRLTEAFHKAESLAHHAIEQALDQVDPRYREELRSQLEDEERHVAVFTRWLGGAPQPMKAPPVRQRSQAVWFASLLCNEIAGFCQFNMLAGLVGDPAREAEVLEIAEDEIVHVIRLVRWLAPVRQTPEYRVVEGMVSKFMRRLDSRMYQFLPNDELMPLRQQMARITAELLTTLAL